MRIILAFLLLAGCVGAVPAETFSRPNTAAAEKASDFEYCQIYGDANAGNSSYGASIAGIQEVSERRNAHVTLCMLDRGYSYNP